jgi:preprotein translocase subunit YajC
MQVILLILTIAILATSLQHYRQGRKLMSALTDLQAAVTAETTVVASAVTLINGLAAQIASAVAANDSVALEALSTQLTASSAALSAAVTANTPAAPAPVAPAV